jgi:cytochrome c oxidase subunit IV
MTRKLHSVAGAGLKFYWTTWVGLLVLTLVMLVLDQTPMPRLLFVTVILAAMLMKALLITRNFMHLFAESVVCVSMIVVGLVLNAAILFVLIVADAINIFEMTN